MILTAVLLLFVLAPGAAAAHLHPVAPPGGTLVFSLTISEHREEYKDASLMDGPPDVTFSSDFVLFGRIGTRKCGDENVVIFADSIVYESRSPLVLSTFMSPDTMYYRARGGTAPIDRSGLADYDSMLACLFQGPAALVEYTTGGDIRSFTHFKDRCPGGQYGHVNLPVTLGFFMPDSALTHGEENTRGEKAVVMPSFSGIGFYPKLTLSYVVFGTGNGLKTISVTGDSTITDRRTTTPGKEEVTIMSGRFRLGGTLSLDERIGLYREGEIRIRETMELSRPVVSRTITGKRCEYTIRFQIH